MEAPFEEKSVWVQLGSLVVVLLGYGAVAGRMMAAGVNHLVPFVPVFAVAVVLLVVLLVIGHVVAAVVRRPEGRDERDRLIEWKAESRAGWVLGGGVLIGLVGLVCAVSTVWVAHFLLLSLFLAEIGKLMMQLIYYRKGV